MPLCRVDQSLQLMTFRLVIIILLVGSPHVLYGECACCRCQEPCEKTCRLVKEEKKITTTCWGYRCEDFCLGGPSYPKCENCESVCNNDCQTPDVGFQPKRWIWTEWIPGCSAELYTKKKLMKRVVTKKVPSFNWVVEDRCQQCRDKGELVQVPPDATIPPIPDGEFHVVRNFRREAAIVGSR